MKVRIFIESTWNGPKRKPGVAMWLVEYMAAGTPITRQGYIYLEDGTEAQGCLRALCNAFAILKKPCETVIYTQCQHILNTMTNSWQVQWAKAGWINAKGQEVKNKFEWEKLMELMSKHTYIILGEHHDYQNVMMAAVQKEYERWDQ